MAAGGQAAAMGFIVNSLLVNRRFWMRSCAVLRRRERSGTFSFDLQVLFYQAEGNYYANFLGLFLGWKWFGLCRLIDLEGGVGG